MSTRGEELPNASIKLEDGTLARKGCLFSFQNYEGDEDNSLYLAAITDKGYLKFLTEGAFGLDIKSQFHGETHAEFYLPLSVAAESLVCYSRGGLVNTTSNGKSRSKRVMMLEFFWKVIINIFFLILTFLHSYTPNLIIFFSPSSAFKIKCCNFKHKCRSYRKT